MPQKSKATKKNKPADKNKTGAKNKTVRKKQTHVADKNDRKKARVSFQHCGTERLKFVHAVELTDSLAQTLGRSVWKIIPREMRELENGVPVISIFRDIENKNLILRCDRVKRYDILVTDENGNAKLEPLKL